MNAFSIPNYMERRTCVSDVVKKPRPTVEQLLSHPATQRLCQIAMEAGYSVDLNLLLPAGKVGGHMDMTNHLIALCPFDADGTVLSLEEFCFYLAHEVRHVMHVQSGRFSSYYNPAYDLACAEGPFGPASLALLDNVPDLMTGLSAERDCDRFAHAYVHGYLEAYHIQAALYPASGVSGYSDYLGKQEDTRLGLVAPARALEERYNRLRHDLSPAAESSALSDARSQSLAQEVFRLRSDLAALSAACGKQSVVRFFCASVTLSLMEMVKERGLADAVVALAILHASNQNQKTEEDTVSTTNQETPKTKEMAHLQIVVPSSAALRLDSKGKEQDENYDPDEEFGEIFHADLENRRLSQRGSKNKLRVGDHEQEATTAVSRTERTLMVLFLLVMVLSVVTLPPLTHLMGLHLPRAVFPLFLGTAFLLWLSGLVLGSADRLTTALAQRMQAVISERSGKVFPEDGVSEREAFSRYELMLNGVISALASERGRLSSSYAVAPDQETLRACQEARRLTREIINSGLSIKARMLVEPRITHILIETSILSSLAAARRQELDRAASSQANDVSAATADSRDQVDTGNEDKNETGGETGRKTDAEPVTETKETSKDDLTNLAPQTLAEIIERLRFFPVTVRKVCQDGPESEVQIEVGSRVSVLSPADFRPSSNPDSNPKLNFKKKYYAVNVAGYGICATASDRRQWELVKEVE